MVDRPVDWFQSRMTTPDPLTLTIVLGVLSTLATRLLTGLTFTTTAFYWVGWACALASARVISGWEMMPELTPNTAELVLKLHTGAFIGFLVAAMIGSFSKNEMQQPTLSGTNERFRISATLENICFAVAASVSIGQLIYRFKGGALNASDVLEVRTAFLESNLSIGQRLLTQCSQITAAVPALFALEDAQEGKVRVKRMAIFFAIIGLGGLTSGGRGWITTPVLTYLFPYLGAIDGKNPIAKAASAFWQFRYVLVAMLVLFTGILFLRSKEGTVSEKMSDQKSLPWYQRDLGVEPILAYFGTPTCAMSAYADMVEPWAPTYGGMSLGWFAGNLAKIGVYPRFYSDEYLVDGREYIRTNVDYRIASTHATLVPRLVADAGREGLLWAMAGLALLCELLYVTQRNRGFIPHLIAATCVQFGGFWVQQDLMLFAGGIILPIFWAWVFMRFFGDTLKDPASEPILPIQAVDSGTHVYPKIRNPLLRERLMQRMRNNRRGLL